MKQISTLLCFLFIVIFTFAQPTYTKYFGIPGSNNDFEGNSMIPLPNGEVIVLGVSIYNNKISKWDIDFVKLDAIGNVLIQKKIATDFSCSDLMGIATSDGGYLLFMALRELPGNNIQLLWGAALIKLNSNGEIEWSKYYNSTVRRHIIPGEIIETRSGDYIMQYSFADDILINERMGIMKVSRVGDVIWKTTLHPTIKWYYEYFGTSILEASNGKIYIGGFMQTEDPFTKDHSTIMRLSKNGELEKAVYFHNPLESGFRIYKLYQINSKLVAYGDYTFNFNMDLSEVVTGTAMDFRYFLFRKHPSLRPQQLGRFCYFENGGIVEFYRGSVDHTGYDIFVKKYDSLFRICPDYIATEINETTSRRRYLLSDLKVLPINDIVTVSDINVYDSTVNFVQTVCTGNVPPFLKSNLLLQENISKISIYPNPADNILHVLNLKADEKYQLTIMNNLGNVFKKSFVENASIYDINLSGLKAGVYLLKVQSTNTNTSIMFIKN